MSRFPQEVGKKGSLRWIQHFANVRRSEIDAAIESASDGRIRGPIRWCSPLEEDEFAEYRDEAFLDRLEISLTRRSLQSFWPRRGPQWDALALDRAGAPVLVEAKANVREIISPPTQAGVESKERIDVALREVADHLGVNGSADWSGTFYQYTNRLAHLYLLSEANGLDAWLVFVYFIGDEAVKGPATREEWEAALEVLHGALGLRRHRMLRRKVDVFLDVR